MPWLNLKLRNVIGQFQFTNSDNLLKSKFILICYASKHTEQVNIPNREDHDQGHKHPNANKLNKVIN